ncbi:MAG: hypothetical protein LBF09_05380, partial [Odoribacteraceae bacterium]|nr:hypothetical protein [Odoribacteraceae bacterium]
MKTTIAILIAACTALLLPACSGEEQEKTLLDIIEQEKTEIRAFLSAQGEITVTPIVYLSKRGQI